MLIDFQAKRDAVFSRLPKNALAILASAPIQYRNSDTDHLFRQDSYFYYLTGLEESYAILALMKTDQGNRTVLFCQERNEAEERWHGPRVGVQGAKEILGVDEAFPISEAALRFPGVFHDIEQIFYLVGIHPGFEKKLFSWINALRKQNRKGTTVPHRYVDLRHILDEQRIIKSPDELACIRKACDVTASAHLQAMQIAAPDLYEYSLEAELLHCFYKHGSRHVAYNPIVATGSNACILHYVANKAKLEAGQLVLIDAGCEIGNYAADVTRTFPVDGQFSKAQQALYDIVLDAQEAAIKCIQPGVTWDTMQSEILKTLVTGLVDLGILTGDRDTLIQEEAYKPFYMHSSGHWMGLDVHDVGNYKVQKEWRPLAPGMVFTVEPGLYIDADNMNVPEKYRGIGIRIEDDVLVTETGHDVLTSAAPKSVSEIEKAMK